MAAAASAADVPLRNLFPVFTVFKPRENDNPSLFITTQPMRQRGSNFETKVMRSTFDASWLYDDNYELDAEKSIASLTMAPKRLIVPYREQNLNDMGHTIKLKIQIEVDDQKTGLVQFFRRVMRRPDFVSYWKSGDLGVQFIKEVPRRFGKASVRELFRSEPDVADFILGMRERHVYRDEILKSSEDEEGRALSSGYDKFLEMLRQVAPDVKERIVGTKTKSVPALTRETATVDEEEIISDFPKLFPDGGYLMRIESPFLDLC